MRLTGALAALFLAAAATTALGDSVGLQADAVAARLQADRAVGPDLEREARAIEAMLVAPCCWSQQVSVHQSAAAAEIKTEIRDALGAGRSRRQIVDAYVTEYGPRILVEPPARGFGAWLYVLPVAALVLSAAGVGLLVRRFTRRGAPEPSLEREVAEAPDRALSARLDDELQDLD